MSLNFAGGEYVLPEPARDDRISPNQGASLGRLATGEQLIRPRLDTDGISVRLERHLAAMRILGPTGQSGGPM